MSIHFNTTQTCRNCGEDFEGDISDWYCADCLEDNEKEEDDDE